jgi:predicted ATPase/DNA-binding SARP family transcriptional activator
MHAFETKRAAKLLVLLGLSRTGTLRREDVADLLWPDDFLDSTRLRLRQELSRLKRGLGPAADLVTTSTEEVSMDRTAIENDLDRLKFPERQDFAEVSEILREEFLPGWDDAWALAERSRADQLRVRAAAFWASKLLDEKRPQEALDTARAGIKLDPLSEELPSLAMRAHAALGSLADAVIEFRRFKRQRPENALEEPAYVAPPVEADLNALLTLPEPPHPIDRFYGREDLIALVRSGLSESDGVRLTSLIGPGGMGKSRLAIEACRDLALSVGFVSFVECAPDADPAAFLLSAVLRGGSSDEPLDALARHLGSMPCVFVLDNLEHLANPGGFVGDLLRLTPTLRLIVTSRRAMKVAGERVVNVGSLPPEAAQPMLIDLAGRQVADVSRIVEMCDGMPLTLRLAAARLRLMEPSELVEELEQSVTSLRANLPDLPERHRDLDRLLGLAYDALSADDQRHLLELSFFPGGVTRAIAKSFMGSSVDEVLERLLDTALIWLDDETSPMRFRALESVRQFVQERANPADREAARMLQILQMRKVVEAFVPAWELYSDPDRRTFRREMANFRAAIDAALDSDVPSAHILFQGLWHDELEVGRRSAVLAQADVLMADPGISDEQRAHVLLAQAWCASAAGELDQTAELALQARDLFEQAGCAADAAYALLAHYEHLRYKSEWSDVLTRYAELEALATRECPGILPTIRTWRGLARTYRNEWEEAQVDLEYGYDASVSAQNIGTRVLAGVPLCAVDYAMNRPDAWRTRLAELRPLVAAIDDPHHWSIFQRAEARFALVDGDFAAAEAHARKGLRLFAFAGNLLHDCEIKVSLARALIGQGRLAEARTVIRETAPAVSRQLRRVGVVAAACLAELCLKAGDTAAAQNALSVGLAYREAHSVNVLVMEADYVQQVEDAVGPISPPAPISEEDLITLLS